MGCGSSDAVKLVEFLEIMCGSKIVKHLQQVEKVMGPIQVALKIQAN